MRLGLVKPAAWGPSSRLVAFEYETKRRGLELLLVEHPREIPTVQGEHIAVVVPVVATGYRAIETLKRTRPNTTVVAGLPSLTRQAALLAFRSQADTVVALDQSPAQVVETAAQATRGLVKGALLSMLLAHHAPRGIESEQYQWLNLLAAGWTTERVAHEVHRSPSDLRRQLHALYRQLNAANLLEAILIAQRQGWLD